MALLVLAVAQLVTTAFLLFALLRRKTGEAATIQAFGTIADTVRTEADRVRSDAAGQSLTVRQGLDEAIQRFQDSLLNRLDVAIENIRLPIAGIGQKLDTDIAKMGKEASENREALRQAIQTRLDTFGDRQVVAARELREELTGNFKRTSDILSATSRDLGAQQQERLDKVAAELKNMSDQHAAMQETLRNAVESRLDAIRTENSAKLDEMRQTVDEKLQTALEQRLGESFRTVSEQLDRVHKGLGEMQTLATGVGDLKRVLSNVKTRGTLAEGQLGNLLGDFLSPDQFIKNAQIKAGSAERVEFAIKFAVNGTDSPLLLPIDAKFPRDDYERLVEAADRADSESMEQASLALETRIKAFAKSIGDKYISPPVTTDFGILFLPTEGLFAEVLRRPGLHEAVLREHRVMIAGPTTLSSMLSAFQMGFRSLAIQQRSSEVWKILGAVRTEFADHGKVVGKLQKLLGTASKTIDDLGTRTRAMNRKLRDVETLPGTDAQAVLGLTVAVLASEEEDSVTETEATVAALH